MLRIERTLSPPPRTGHGSPRKGGKSRSVRLTPRALEALRAHRARQNAERLEAVVWEPGDLIFTISTGGVIRLTYFVSDPLRAMVDRAGLPPSTQFHDLRHTCATILLARGVDVVSVQRLLGHASAVTTLNVYAHYVPSMAEQTTAAIESALG